MRLDEVISILQSLQDENKITNFALDHFSSAQQLPYAAFYQMDSSPFGADNTTYHDQPAICVEFYTARIDYPLMNKFEEKVVKNRSFYARNRPLWIPEQEYYMTVYYMN